jgi:hypothetical protein
MDGRRSRSMPWRSSPTGSWPGDVCSYFGPDGVPAGEARWAGAAADIEVLEEIKKARNLPLPPM